MSDNNEDQAEANKAKSKPQQSRPSQKKRSASSARKPSKTSDPADRGKVSEKTTAPADNKDQLVSGQSERRQPSRRPAKKKSTSGQDRPGHQKSDLEPSKAPADENQKSTGDSKPTEREQPARRPAKRKSDSNRRRSGSSSRSSSRGGRSNRPKPTLRQPPVNPEELQAKAWELYRADISEESTAMFNEDEASDLVRRSFILADIFMRFREQLFDTGSAAENNPPESPESSAAE